MQTTVTHTKCEITRKFVIFISDQLSERFIESFMKIKHRFQVHWLTDKLWRNWNRLLSASFGSLLVIVFNWFEQQSSWKSSKFFRQILNFTAFAKFTHSWLKSQDLDQYSWRQDQEDRPKTIQDALRQQLFPRNRLMDTLAMCATAAMAGIATDYGLQAIITNDKFTLDNDIFTFIASVITSVAMFITIILFKYKDKSLGKPSFCIAVGILVLWIVALFMYISRKTRSAH